MRRGVVAVACLFAAWSCSARDLMESELVGRWRAEPASLRRLTPEGKPEARLELAADGTFKGEGIPSSFVEFVVEPVMQANDRISMNGKWRLRKRDGRQIVELSFRNPGIAQYTGALAIEPGREARLYFHLSDPDENQRFVFERER